MKYLSVCSGIEAASKAWEPIGWEPVAFSEIEAFPSAVLKHHWPKVQNLGDMTQHEQWNIPSGTIDLLVGGTPCQSFSVAGLRQGLKDPRGNLMLTYLAIAERLKPRWLVWENVPGVLSSNGGKDFGSFLGALGELGYEWAYRVLDAQWFGVAQRRRRVFVVAHLGEGSLAAKVLFESESVRRDNAPSREARQGVATNVAPSLTASNDPSRSPQSSEVTQQVNAVLEAVAETLMASDYKGPGHNRDHNFITEPVAYNITFCDANGTRSDRPDGGLYVNKTDVTGSLTRAGIGTNVVQPVATPALYENHPNDSRVTGPHDVAPSCVSRYGTGGGNVPLVQEAIAFPAAMSGTQCAKTKNLSPAICSVNQTAVAVDCYNKTIGDKSQSISSSASDINHTGGVINPADRMAVRRLTPKECERLQGFDDDHTMIPWRNKSADQCPDGPRYKALGNSMAVPCMAWIGKRIDAVEKAK
jgi:DNA (cytosine-5)-methyltransferase 1